MKSLGRVCAIVFLVFTASMPNYAKAAPNPCDGAWLGRVTFGETTLAFRVTKDKTGCQASIAGMGGPAGAPFKIAQDEYTFSLGSEEVKLVARTISANLIKGDARSGPKSGAFELRRLAKDADKRAAALIGLYAFPDGRYAAVTPFDEFGDATFFIDYRSGLIGPMLAMADASILIGNGLIYPLLPEAGRIEAKAKNVIAVREGGAHLEGRAVPLAREVFTATNGKVRLSGEIVRRADITPRGTVVMVHGSNDAKHTVFGPWTNYLVARGWAVAAFDKRGSGQSTGDWHYASFADLAGDVREVVAYARGRPYLAGRPVGLLGLSQAGWIMPIVGAEANAVDFIISIVGAAVTPTEQTLQLVEAELKAYAMPEKEIAAALAYYRLDIDVSTGRKPFKAIEGAYKEARARGAEWLLHPPEPPDAPSRIFFRNIADFDALPYWRRLKIPVLAMYGDKDLIVPPQHNRARMEQAMKQAGHKASRVVVLPGINHIGLRAETGVLAEYPRLTHFAPEYFRTLGDWLDGLSAAKPR